MGRRTLSLCSDHQGMMPAQQNWQGWVPEGCSARPRCTPTHRHRSRAGCATRSIAAQRVGQAGDAPPVIRRQRPSRIRPTQANRDPRRYLARPGRGGQARRDSRFVPRRCLAAGVPGGDALTTATPGKVEGCGFAKIGCGDGRGLAQISQRARHGKGRGVPHNNPCKPPPCRAVRPAKTATARAATHRP